MTTSLHTATSRSEDTPKDEQPGSGRTLRDTGPKGGELTREQVTKTCSPGVVPMQDNQDERSVPL